MLASGGITIQSFVDWPQKLHEIASLANYCRVTKVFNNLGAISYVIQNTLRGKEVSLK